MSDTPHQSTLEDLRVKLKRRAIVFDVDDSRPAADPLESRFGRVSVGLPGEIWPEWQGKQLQALCQINLRVLPFRPPRLGDVAFLAVFIDPNELPGETPNGEGWALRAYDDVDALVPLPQPTNTAIKPLPMRPRLVERDYPCWEDVPIELPADIADRYHDRFKNTFGLKLGGWPSLIQSELCWAPWHKHAAAPEYVFQIDSIEECQWSWGDAGVGYFGRGTTPGKENEWTMTWQCC